MYFTYNRGKGLVFVCNLYTHSSVLQCVAACCSELQRVTVCCSVLHVQCVAVCCSVLQRVSEAANIVTNEIHFRIVKIKSGKRLLHRTHLLQRCSVLQCVPVYLNAWQCSALCCSVLQCAAVCSSVLHCVAIWQRIAVCRNMSLLQYVAVCCGVW